MQSHYQQQQRISFNSNNSNSNSMYSSQWQPFQQYQPFKLSSAAIATAATSQICNVLPVPSSVTDGKWNDTKETMMSPSSSPSSTFNQRYNEHISPSSVHMPTQAENINKKSSKEKPSLLLNLLFDEPIPFVNPFSPTPIDSEDDPALTFFTSTTPSPLTSTRSISSVDSPSRISSKRSLDDDEDRTSSSSSNEYKSYINKKQRVNMNMYQSERLTKETLTSIQQNNIPKNKNEEMETTSTFNTINNIIRPQPLIYSSSSRALPAPAPAVAFAPIKPAVLKTNANLCKNVNGEKQQQHLDEETKIEINVDTNNDESKAPITISGVLRNNTTLVLDMVTPKDSSRILPQKFHIVQSPLDGKHRILSNQFKLRTACDRCTKMKIRCIPLKPGQCEGCKKRKIDCIFSPQKKRGPVNMCQSQTPANFPLQQ